MLVFYCVLRQLAPDTTEVCLIDITHEATEIGIVRDGILKYVTHVPFGTFTIARDIASLCKVPNEEALAYLRGNTALEQTRDNLKAFAKTNTNYIKAVEEQSVKSYNSNVNTSSKNNNERLTKL